MRTFVTQSKTLVSFPLISAIAKLTLPIGISIQKSRDADNSIMEDVAETIIVSPQKVIAKADVAREMRNHQEHSHREGMMHPDQLNHQGKPADHPLGGKRTAVCCLMHLETVASRIEDSTMTEAMEFAVNSSTRAVMETKITSRRLKNVRAFVMMLLASVIWRRFTVDARKISQSGIMMHTVRNVKSLSSAVVTGIRTISMTRDHVKMLADKTAVLLKPNMFRPQDLAL